MTTDPMSHDEHGAPADAARPEIGRIRDDDLRDAFDLKTEYLDDSDYGGWKQRREAFPDLFLAARVQDRVVGICYGWPAVAEGLPDSIVLQGIAVADAWSSRGIGSQLLSAFELAALERGAASVSLGSAGGYVDRFYSKNGYEPTDYMICLAADRAVDAALRQRFALHHERLDGDLRRLYVAIDRLDEELRQKLLSAFAADEVIAIMQKDLVDRPSP